MAHFLNAISLVAMTTVLQAIVLVLRVVKNRKDSFYRIMVS